jgi:hypothetical protein
VLSIAKIATQLADTYELLSLGQQRENFLKLFRTAQEYEQILTEDFQYRDIGEDALETSSVNRIPHNAEPLQDHNVGDASDRTIA